MTKSSTSWQLFFDGSGTPSLRSLQRAVHPGCPYPEAKAGETIYLSSGFGISQAHLPSDLHPGTSLPLSPTLQLNGDLTDLDDDVLASIGRAELNRLNSLRFRSYTIEADGSVIVIGSSAGQLNTFLDTYGGILQISPLLSRGFSEQFDTLDEAKIKDAEISEEKNGIIIQYLSRKPLLKDHCTLCGSCVSVCPENCISEQLYLDLSRCTLCNECVKVCPSEAIDLHGVLTCRVEAASLLVLKGVSVELPQPSSRVFNEEQLDLLFATVCDCQVDEVITCNRGICQYSTRIQSGCDCCLSVCPSGAISASDKGIVINQLQCRECGNCVATCPTGALQYLRFDDQAFIDYFTEIDIEPGSTLVLGSEQLLHKFWWFNREEKHNKVFFLEHPQVQALTAMQLLFLLTRGTSRVILLLSGKSNTALQEQILQTNTIIQGLFDHPDAVLTVQVDELSVLLQDQDSVPKCIDPLPVRGVSGVSTRREKLSKLLSSLQQVSGRSLELTGEPFACFGSIKCNTDTCTLCLACLNECRINGLLSEEQTLSLSHQADACVQCGACVQVCPEGSLQLLPGVILDQQFFQPRELARAEPALCKKCGKQFGTRQSLDRVLEMLRDREEDLELFELCEICRVERIYEEG